jgi:hypothetical protein
MAFGLWSLSWVLEHCLCVLEFYSSVIVDAVKRYVHRRYD